MDVGVVGCGHVGLVTAACMALCGHDVVALDVDVERIAELERGRVPFFEPMLEDVVAAARRNLTFTARYIDLAGCDVIIVAVPSPSTSDGSVDLKFLRQAGAGIASAIQCRTNPPAPLVINKSTLPVGSARLMEEIIVEHLPVAAGGGGRNSESLGVVPVASCPEFLREGRAICDTLYPDRLVFGVDRPGDGETLRRLYAPIIERSFSHDDLMAGRKPALPVVVEVSVLSAELIKYAANAFLATKISFINELAGLCEVTGANVREVADGIGSDRRIGRSFLDAGLGWGGSCFGKDLRALVHTGAEYRLSLPLVEAALSVNQRQRAAVVRLLQEELRVLKGARVALLGLAFKPGTDDLRDAPSLEIAQRLTDLGVKVSAYDPAVHAVPAASVRLEESVLDAVRGCDALVLVTEWDEFRRLPWSEVAQAMRRRVVIDGRNALDADGAVAAGFRYRGVGR